MAVRALLGSARRPARTVQISELHHSESITMAAPAHPWLRHLIRFLDLDKIVAARDGLVGPSHHVIPCASPCCTTAVPSDSADLESGALKPFRLSEQHPPSLPVRDVTSLKPQEQHNYREINKRPEFAVVGSVQGMASQRYSPHF